MGTTVITREMLAERDALRAPALQFMGEHPKEFKQKLDKEKAFTANRRKDLERMLKMTQAEKACTLLNMNPSPLEINGGVYFPEKVKACPPGQPYTMHVFTQTRWGHKDLGCDLSGMMQFEAVPAIPIVLAAEYIREYADKVDGDCGVLVYAGDGDPSTFKKGHKVFVPRTAYTDTGEFYIELDEVDFHEEFARVRTRRNGSILRRLQSANSWYENDEQRMLVNDIHRALARLAVEEGLIPELPRWVMQANTLHVKQPEACPSCQVVPKPGAIQCANCSYIIDVVETFRVRPSACVYGSAEMDRLTPEQWKEVDAIHAERVKNRPQRKVAPTP